MDIIDIVFISSLVVLFFTPIFSIVRNRNKSPRILHWILWYVILGILFLFMFPMWAEEVNVERLADAIYKAEGGDNTSHPYGILAHYKHTTPRQACINTIRHALMDWDGKSDFIAFLGSRYAPIGCNTDNGTNRFWVRNVKVIYAKLTKEE